MNRRALRFVVLELIRDLIGEVTSYKEFHQLLDDLSEKSLLAKHWIKNLVKPVLIMMLFVRAEREGDFLLHYYACKQMMPYFFAASHWNYARDGLVYIRSMERLPNSVLTPFLEGKHVVYLAEGLWNGIWTDMSIESTYMKIGKGPSGIIGVTTKERSVKIWSHSHHLCGELATELEDLRQEREPKLKMHKEELAGRIKSDVADRMKIRNALVLLIHPLKLETHGTNKLVNIYDGEEAGENVNVNRSQEIGEEQMIKFQESLPEGFHATLSTKIVTMAAGKKKTKKK